MSEHDRSSIDDLVPGLPEGDHAAFSAVYDRTIRRVRSITLGILHDRAQAEEVAQETYFEFWRSAGRETPIEEQQLLVSVIARRRAIDRVRAAQSSRERDHRYAIHSYLREIDEAETRGEIRGEFARAAAEIRRLAPKHRDLLFLAYVRGLSHSEIAALLELPVGTVKTRLRDTLARLRRELSPPPA
ncbi:sigma-70 family RNA polymerase sigma factor [Rathayibacter sp. VKM Ac-2760]|uniref:sigma-70 family RNA polymerase sigma factor n=1 Tax=Rathayibacter sp. VKM Ac-2760 TaxID=2609253 RepID=UPI0013183F49|nr:sigma-70 family RNA polymerase sigma factor [Rathayibacter sp. VKM Ac-2760]QHC57683.1 sigma-70 family RNA polymerase sigma factor [Rathayibacter sp. VKM Ac-2760]